MRRYDVPGNPWTRTLRLLLPLLVACNHDDGVMAGAPGDLAMAAAPLDGAALDAGAPRGRPQTSVACTSDFHFQWVNPLPQGNQLHQLLSLARDDVWAVGDAGTILHWDGVKWTCRASRSAQPLLSVSAAGNEVWVAGGGDHFDPTHGGLILRSRGGGDFQVAHTDTQRFSGIRANGPGDVWAAGGIGHALFHFDGSAWQLAWGQSGSEYYSEQLWGSGPTGLWAFGDDTLHFDGKLWSLDATGGGLNDLSGSGPGDLWGSSIGGLYQYGGKGWNKAQTWMSVQPETILANAPDDVWTAGRDWVANYVGTLYHFDGRAWTHDPLDLTYVRLADLAGTAADDVWAAGSYGSLYHFDGAGWKSQTSGPPSDVTSLWGSAPDDFWTVGPPFAPQSDGIPAAGSLFHFHGGIWSSEGPARFATALWGSAADDVWAVGHGISHFDGKSWSAPVDHGARDLLAIGGRAPDDVWAVGAGSTVLRFDGTRWTASTTGNNGLAWDLFSVWAAAADDVWIGGGASGEDFAMGAILHFNGRSYSTELTKNGAAVTSIWGSGARDVWAVAYGPFEPAYHWTGAAWTPVDVGQDPQAATSAVWGSAAGDVWISDTLGGMSHFDGNSWSPVDSGTWNGLRGIFGFGPGRFLVHGDGGTILEYRN